MTRTNIKNKRTEILITNYNEQITLFDFNSFEKTEAGWQKN